MVCWFDESPSSELKQLVQFIVGHYVPVWFTVRQNSSCASGAKNLPRSVELLRQKPANIQAVVRPVLQRSSHWPHPEQLLLAMTADDNQETRAKAVQLIRAARLRETEDIRLFRFPAVNFGAERYEDLIDWSSADVTQPPLLRDYSEADLDGVVEAPASLPDYPVHTQAVERTVKVVTEACSSLLGEESRHGLITAKLRHRRTISAFNSKRDVRLLSA
ncbi:hypothetical protein FJT64_024153 [Amphibalanus amphitrite]|uniref:Uncharacterized protein n=1 Tax=Amphibalanus amphitrite TaxID=1232801 RepID=A0A6A4WFB7_AMPAM|nr:hypothetical protein FJT64_024153 [Amphibalanus amphitrite]